jgi:hypothetical protein
MAVLSRGGCNQGACHGNQNGKNGFRLSLRGQDPAFDLAALTRDALGRRTDPLRPADSLVLQKATATVPHEGGRRFAVGSREYTILAHWIAAGARPDPPGTPVVESLTVSPAEAVIVEPVDRLPLRVEAWFSDGQRRDVTRLAVYEPSNDAIAVSPDGEVRRLRSGTGTILVRYVEHQAAVSVAFVPERPGFRWPDVPESNVVDHQVFARLRTLRILPSNLCSDTVFLRRVYLDVLGVLPAADEVRAFLSDSAPDRRARWIDRLLQRPEFAEFWALKWSDLLRNEEKVLDQKGVEAFHHWIQQWFAEGRPLDAFARELVSARGSTYANPAANFYRALRDPQARAEAVAQVFLGVRLQCARCHNHPFERWTQEDYHALAACFARVRYKIVENRRRDRFDLHEFDGEQIVWQDRAGEGTNPRTGAVLRPHVLGSAGPELSPHADRLQVLADWIVAPDNPFFARAQANRVWFHLMGRGIVEPNDDFRASNPPANGTLLDALAHELVAARFDLRHLVRIILNSRTYQLSAVPNDTNADDEAQFSHALVRPLQAEQLLDALAGVLQTPVKFRGYPLGTRAGQLAGVRSPRPRGVGPTEGERFLQRFGKPERLLGCECERSQETTLGQSFQMLSGPLVNELLSRPDNRIGRLLAAGRSNREIIEVFYLAALSRPPAPVEAAAACAYVDRARDRRAALEDVVWGIVNAKEFLLRQ